MAQANSLDRLHSLQFSVSPEERQLLGITDEDIAAFSDENLKLTPREIQDAIQEIIEKAYDEIPAFKNLVDTDSVKDPNRLGRSAKVVDKLLMHLRGVLPPEKKAAIAEDSFLMAHEMVRGTLYNKMQRPQAPVAVPEEKIDPITDSDLALFNIPRTSLTERTTWSDIRDGILFFLGKLKGPDGKTVKNEAVKGMPDEIKIQVLSKLFNDIRQKKLAAHGDKLSPSDEHFVGKNIAQLKQMARSMVVPAEGKADPVYQNDLMEVNSQAGEVVRLIDRVQEISKDPKFTAAIEDLTSVLDTALPPASLFEDRINSIQEEISKLGLSKAQMSALTQVDPGSLSYNDPVKKILEEQKGSLQDIQKEISKSGDTPDLLLKRKNIENQIKQLEDLSGKDTNALKVAIEDYLGTLKKYSENIKTTISGKKLDDAQQKTLSNFGALIDELALVFSRLTREEVLKARWAGRSGFLVRNENKPAPAAPAPAAPAPAAPASAVPGAKVAAETAGYASKLEKFRGSGLSDAYNEIQGIIWDDDKLPAIKGKLIDILGFKDRIESIEKVMDSGKPLSEIKRAVSVLTQGTVYGSQINEILGKSDDLKKLKQVITNILKKDRTIVSQRVGVSHADISLEDALKDVVRLRSLIKKLDIKDKGKEATDILEWAATLQNHIKTVKKPATSVLASTASCIRKIAMQLLNAEEGGKSKHYQSPAGIGSDQPLKSPGKARPILFRERITKMGKKALQSVFDEPTFVPNFVEEMEKAGLSNMMLHGGELKEVDIEPVLNSVLQKVTGKKGNLENILGTKVMQEYNSKFNIATTKKDLEEATARVRDLNSKISETEDKYLPKLEEYAQFIKDPISATREQLAELRGKSKETGKEEDTGTRGVTEEVRAEEISASNYRSVLKRLTSRYIDKKEDIQDSTGITESMFKLARDEGELKNASSDLAKTLPSEFVKQYMVWKKQLKNIKSSTDREADPYKKAVELEKYYTFMMTLVKKLSEYLDYQGKVLKADGTMIKGIDSFIKSDAAKNEKPEFIQDSRDTLEKLRGAFEQQKKIFDSVNKTHADLGAVHSVVKDQLSVIRDDISDKKVEMLYQVAISPDLVPDKETARKIKERAKEHEKGLSFIIDRSTYKNNMNRLMTYKRESRPFKSAPGGDVTLLGPERKKEFEQKLQESKELARKIKEEADYGTREVAYKKLEDDLARAKSIVEEENKLIEDYSSLIQNIDYIISNKDSMDTTEYEKQVAILNELLKTMRLYQDKSTNDIKVDRKHIKSTIKEEKEYLDRVVEYITDLETEVEKSRKELETKRPPVNVDRKIELLLQRLYRVRLMVQHNVDKPYDPQEEEKLLEEKLKQLKELEGIPISPVPGTPSEVEYRKFKNELDRQLKITTRDLEDIKKKSTGTSSTGVTPMAKTAAIEDTMPDLSPYEKALETKGVKPAPFMQELPKPKGWEIVENFFNEVKREHKLIKNMKENGKSSPLQSQYLKKRVDQIENMAEAIDSFKNQKVSIGGDSVAFRDVMLEFENLLSKYQDLLTKYTNQREDAVNRVAYLQQELDHYNDLYDETTGEFKGLDPEEVANLKDMFLRMLYKDLERYWATRVGKDLSVFGERDTNWYNVVFSTFKNVAKARSNKKMLGLLNKYKQETRSDFDDIVNRTKSQQLEKERDKLLEGYEEYKVDPQISSRLKEFNTRIETLKKQEAQMDRVFKFMGAASLVALQSDYEKMLRAKSSELSNIAQTEEPLSKTKVKLEDKAVEETNKAIEALEEELPVIIENAKEVSLAENDLEKLKSMKEERLNIPEGVPSTEKVPGGLPDTQEVKVAYDKNHRDFNLNVLYGSHMQKTITGMLAEALI